MANSTKTRWSATIRSQRLARIAWPRPSTLRCTLSFPSPTWITLHPDWAIALAASANGKQKLDEFNKEFDRKIVWLPWQRPGFELAPMIERAVKDNPAAEGLILGGHGLFTWGTTQRDCYREQHSDHRSDGRIYSEASIEKGISVRRSRACSGCRIARILQLQILPTLRGAVSSNRRVIAHYADR